MRFVLLSILLVPAIAGSAAGQMYYYGGYRPYGYSPWGGYMPYGGTVAGSYAAGMGQMIQAQGAYNQMTAQAATQMEEAKRLALDNKLKSAQTYYQLQRLNQENRVEQERQRLANQKAYTPPPPRRLGSDQLDPVTGRITWPTILAAPNFQPEREQLDALFMQRAKDPTSVPFSVVSQLVLAMRDKLDGLHDMLPTGDFFASRHFLDALVNEVRFSEPLASVGNGPTP